MTARAAGVLGLGAVACVLAWQAPLQFIMLLAWAVVAPAATLCLLLVVVLAVFR